jgi:hypothetical protein
MTYRTSAEYQMKLCITLHAKGGTRPMSAYDPTRKSPVLAGAHLSVAAGILAMTRHILPSIRA